MTPLPSPQSQQEQAYVANKIRAGYWSIPVGVPYILVPLFGGVAFAASVDEVRFPLPIIFTIAASLFGLLIAGLLVARIPDWNRARRESIQIRAHTEFHEKFESLSKQFQSAVLEFEQFRRVVKSKSYRLYVQRARAAERSNRFSSAQFALFFEDTPSAVAELRESVEALIQEVESDTNAIAAYEPSLMDRVSSLERRAAAGNIPDCYRASRELDEILTALEERNSPFDFSEAICRLRDRAQQCRDAILSDPAREVVWRDVQHKDEMRREEERHNRAMEEAAEAEAEAARMQADAASRQVALTEEANQILREQRNALRANAVGTAATALYTRKGANAMREMADRPSRSD